jgi:hypothetical protein
MAGNRTGKAAAARSQLQGSSSPMTMLLRRLHDAKLAQVSYPVGCTISGEALVVAPNRGVSPRRLCGMDRGRSAACNGEFPSRQLVILRSNTKERRC